MSLGENVQVLSAANQQLNMSLDEKIQHLHASTQLLLERSEFITSCVALAPSATGGWMRVAELDMTNSGLQCPSGFILRTNSKRRTCGISLRSGCSSVTFSGLGLQYSRVVYILLASNINSGHRQTSPSSVPIRLHSEIMVEYKGHRYCYWYSVKY